MSESRHACRLQPATTQRTYDERKFRQGVGSVAVIDAHLCKILMMNECI